MSRLITKLEDIGKDFKTLAIEKIKAEMKDFKGDNKGKAVHTYVANALRDFCEQNILFAEAVAKTKRSFSDCVRDIMKGSGNAISDIEVYRRAAKFFFPNSEVEFTMTITLRGEFPSENYLNKEASSSEKRKTENSKVKPEKTKTLKKSPNTEKETADVIQLTLF